MLWRTSLFLYAKYDTFPYFTYWRITVFTVNELDRYQMKELEYALRDNGEIMSSLQGWDLQAAVKTEVEQVDASESKGIGVNRVELSISDGTEPTPYEDLYEYLEINDRLGLGPAEPVDPDDVYLEDSS